MCETEKCQNNIFILCCSNLHKLGEYEGLIKEEHLNIAHSGKWNTLGETEQLLLFTEYKLDSKSLIGEEKNLLYHRLVEAFKFSNGLKKYIRDPGFSSEEVSSSSSNEV